MSTRQELQHAIARNLRLFRQRRGLSLDELAARAGISRAMIVQIEQARTNPSINTLCSLAEALGESVPALVDVQDASPVRLITADEAVELWRGRRGSSASVLAGAGSSGPVELWEWRLKLGDVYQAPAHAHGTREMLFVISGDVRLTVGDREYDASAGQTLFFHANEDHRYAALNRGGAHLLMVVLEPTTVAVATSARTKPPARTHRATTR